MQGASRALEDVGRGLGRSFEWQNDPDDDRAPRPPRVEPIEPVHIEPLEPSRFVELRRRKFLTPRHSYAIPEAIATP